MFKETDVSVVYNTLRKVPNIDVYMKSDIPDDLHYKLNVRIGDMIIVTKVEYAVYINKQNIDWNLNKGDHGYYNNESTMFPIFISHGPSFKANFKINSFNNVDIYPLMCFILDVEPACNNGSLENVIDMVLAKSIEKKFNLGISLALALNTIITLFLSVILFVFKPSFYFR